VLDRLLRGTFGWRGLGGLVLSTRSAVIALAASAVTVLVLAGMTSGMLATPSLDSLIGQPIPVDQRLTGTVPAPVAPPLQPLPPAPAELPPPAPANPTVEVSPAAPVKHPAVAARREPASTPRPARPEPVVQPVSNRGSTPRQPAPVLQQPAPPAQQQPVARPPAATAPAASTKSRTRNVEPCDCDGTMRRVPTHWDPPQG
jgi:hypothetical protein